MDKVKGEDASAEEAWIINKASMYFRTLLASYMDGECNV